MRYISFSALLLSALLCLQGCASLETAGTPAPDPSVLRVGITPNMPPFIFKDAGTIAGLEADMARALGEALGRKTVFVELPWESLIPALQEDRIDMVMSGMSITPEREAQVYFADPYVQAGQTVLMRVADIRDYAYPELIVLTKGKIGIEAGTTGELFAQSRCPKATLVPFPSAEAAVKALVRRRVDMVIHDAPVIWNLAADYEDRGVAAAAYSLTEEYLAWAVNPGDPKLLADANRVRAQWKADGRLSEFVRRWLPWAKQ